MIAEWKIQYMLWIQGTTVLPCGMGDGVLSRTWALSWYNLETDRKGGGGGRDTGDYVPSGKRSRGLTRGQKTRILKGEGVCAEEAGKEFEKQM